MGATKTGEVPKLPRNRAITQIDMTKWWKEFTVYQKVNGEKWITYINNEPTVAGHWQMVGGTVGPSVQPMMPNHVLIVIAADALAPARHAAERQNGDMVKETRRQTERLAGERLVMAEMIKDCVEPILPTLMRTAGGPEIFEDPISPLKMLQMIRLFNPHDREMVGNTVRNFYEAESFFKGNYQGSASAYEFIEAKKTQWEHLIALSNRANATAVGSVAMMTERERVTVLMSILHGGYKPIKRRIDLGEIDEVNSMEEFITFINRYELTAAENRPKLVQPRKIFATTKSAASGRICKLIGHTQGHQYGGTECNLECSKKLSAMKSGKERYAAEKRDDVRRVSGEEE